MALTIGEIAGIINVGIVLLQFTFPLLLVFVLTGLLPDHNNAATWSVSGRVLQGSWWPTLLRSDTAATSKVSYRVIFISALSTVGLLILAVAAILTPLGLYDTITETKQQESNFVYVRDLSPVGQATLDRDSYNTSRLCGAWTWLNCPGQAHGFYYTSNATGEYVNWDNDTVYISSVVPDNLTEVFSSGMGKDRATVASPFDIQFRSYKLMRNPEPKKSVLLDNERPPHNIDQQRLRTVGTFQMYESYILADDFIIREGIIADMRNGGLGFRNHTIPDNAHQGVEWTEGLLWVEPETVCVNNNITVEFQLPIRSALDQQNYLVDRGGLTGPVGDYPYIDLNNTQIQPELYARAHKGAVLMNYNLRLLLGISTTNASYPGKKFLLGSSSSYDPGVAVTSTFDSGVPASYLRPDPSTNTSAKMMENIDLLVKGYGGFDIANFSHIASAGGVILGAPTSTDHIDNNRNDPGTNYSAPIFSCATALRAYIKDFTFYINSSATLENLKVRRANPRTYPSNDTTPLWAVENTWGMNISDVQPVWGIVDDKYEKHPGLWTLRRDFIYLPAGSGSFNFISLNGLSDSSGWSAPIRVLQLLYGSSSLYGQLGEVPVYSGETSKPLKDKWQGLSQSPDGIPTMVSLIWTDITASYVTGTRSLLNANFTSTTTADQRQGQKIPTSVKVSTLTYEHAIGFRFKYAAPAVIFLSIYVLVLAVALVLWVSRKSTFRILNALVNQTSVGRAVTMERYKRDGSMGIRARTKKTSEWIKEFGGEDIGISKTVSGNPHDDAGVGEAQEYEPVQTSQTGEGKGT